LRPFESVYDLNSKLGQGKKKAGPAGISPRMFEDCIIIFEGYGQVDSILEDCERIGSTLRLAIASWTEGKVKDTSVPNQPSVDTLNEDEGSVSLLSLSPPKAQKPKDYLTTQPTLLADDVELKEYQLLGVNWLQLLYRRKLSCILADEMGAYTLYDSSLSNGTLARSR
jgi:SWI/SNF-related matrix-associated actin-dependent regulator of chromatin subfamily A containing DEAD/H box 1